MKDDRVRVLAFKCVYCGRYFGHKIKHLCNGQYRKRRLKFESIKDY